MDLSHFIVYSAVRGGQAREVLLRLLKSLYIYITDGAESQARRRFHSEAVRLAHGWGVAQEPHAQGLITRSMPCQIA